MAGGSDRRRGWYAAWVGVLVVGVGLFWAASLPGVVVGVVTVLRYGPRVATLAMIVMLPLGLYAATIL